MGIDGEGLMQNVAKINFIPEENSEKFKVAILEEYEINWQQKIA